jgi:hypothetical protein
MTIKVIGAGFSRTGTGSMKAALEHLGYSECYHVFDLGVRPDHMQYWEAAADKEPVEWSKVFEGFQAVVDTPGFLFFKELLNYYPQAKVVLTIRDPNNWYDSARSTIYQKFSRANLRAKLMLKFHAFRKTKFQGTEMFRLRRRLFHFKAVQQGVFNWRFHDREYAIKVFEEHIETVKKAVPPEKLLIFQVKEGWEPLCEFLEVGVPVDDPFPHLHQREEMGDLIYRRPNGGGRRP